MTVHMFGSEADALEQVKNLEEGYVTIANTPKQISNFGFMKESKNCTSMAPYSVACRSVWVVIAEKPDIKEKNDS